MRTRILYRRTLRGLVEGASQYGIWVDV